MGPGPPLQLSPHSPHPPLLLLRPPPLSFGSALAFLALSCPLAQHPAAVTGRPCQQARGLARRNKRRPSLPTTVTRLHLAPKLPRPRLTRKQESGHFAPRHPTFN